MRFSNLTFTLSGLFIIACAWWLVYEMYQLRDALPNRGISTRDEAHQARTAQLDISTRDDARQARTAQLGSEIQKDVQIAEEYPKQDSLPDAVPLHKSPETQSKIPRILHFVWVSQYLQDPQTVPDAVLGRIKTWQAVNPGFEIRLWNNSVVKQTFPDLSELLQNIRVSAWISDILRYFILSEMGGLYLDTDFETTGNPLDPLWEVVGDVFIVCDPKVTSLPFPCPK